MARVSEHYSGEEGGRSGDGSEGELNHVGQEKTWKSCRMVVARLRLSWKSRMLNTYSAQAVCATHCMYSWT
jgi:hypothetical protein